MHMASKSTHITVSENLEADLIVNEFYLKAEWAETFRKLHKVESYLLN